MPRRLRFGELGVPGALPLFPFGESALAIALHLESDATATL
jgi:hypothetical protein